MPEVFKGPKRLSLADAQKQGRLDEFVRQEEARLGAGADPKKVENTIATVIKSPRSKGRTSRSASRGGSRGK